MVRKIKAGNLFLFFHLFPITKMTAKLFSSDGRRHFLHLLKNRWWVDHNRETALALERLLKDEHIWETALEVPVKIEHTIPFRSNFVLTCYWLFQNRIYWIKNQSHYSDDEAALLVREEFDKSRRKFERLKRKFENDGQPRTSRREKISESVRVEVWRRDGGQCARCGSRERLEYDHIVPVSKGGSSTARNVELLCESCNRAKADRIE